MFTIDDLQFFPLIIYEGAYWGEGHNWIVLLTTKEEYEIELDFVLN